MAGALLFPKGPLARVERLWTTKAVIPLVSTRTTLELIRVLGYPKFRLDEDDVAVVLAAFLPFADTVDDEAVATRRLPRCRDPHDQVFLNVAAAGSAAVLVSGDEDLLALAPSAPFAIEAPGRFVKRVT